ncbi:hypothetical protein [Acinetobacter nematophilus]|uniref:Uncharacterized protein n=1 Tax=Acinetobacter nematophilus TaxID=2994642 RepID=A0A9X3DPR8_9GAMM|nr:hypothetical protein [Acinetobacter nematophilus]MCX5466183.1 hypothetical protein [Acinetobacter nematophilus]
MYGLKKIVLIFIGLTVNIGVNSAEKQEGQRQYASQSADCISLNVIDPIQGVFNLKNICSFKVNLKYTLSQSQVFSGTYTTLLPNESTFVTGKKDERADFIICEFPDIPEKIGGNCIGTKRATYTGSLVNSGQIVKIQDDDIDTLMDKAQKEGDTKLNQINNNTIASLNQAQQNYDEALAKGNKIASSLQSYTNRINSSGLTANNIGLTSKNTEKASTLNIVQNILSEYVNKQNSIGMDKYSSANTALETRQSKASFNGITASDFSGDVNCTDDYLVSNTQPLIQELSVGASNIGACEGAKRFKILQLKILDLTKHCRSNTVGIMEVREGAIKAIQEANETIEGICGS